MKRYSILFSLLLPFLMTHLSCTVHQCLYIPLYSDVMPSSNDSYQASQERASEYLQDWRNNKIISKSTISLPYWSPNNFKQQGYTEEDIFKRFDLYSDDGFISYIKVFENYAVTIKALHNDLKDAKFLERCNRWIWGSYSMGLKKKIAKLHAEVEYTERCILNSPAISGTEKIRTVLINGIEYHPCIQKCSAVARAVVKNCGHEQTHVGSVVENALTGLQEKVLSDQQIIFNLALVNHIVCDLENIPVARAISLFKQGVTTFFTRLHPEVQWNAQVESIVDTACFVSDLTLGKLYLSPADYRARVNQIYEVWSLLSWDTFSRMSAEQLVDMAAILAADSLSPLALSKSISFLKKMNTLIEAQKAGSKACHYAHGLKNAFKKKYTQRGYTVHPDGTVSMFSPGPYVEGSSVAKKGSVLLAP